MNGLLHEEMATDVKRDCGLRGSQNDAQRYARTQRHDVGHFLTATALVRRANSDWRPRNGPTRKKVDHASNRGTSSSEYAREFSLVRSRAHIHTQAAHTKQDIRAI